MADNTNIEWADSTANLWIGCTKISPGCDNCYAKADWEDRKHRVLWGPHGDRSYCAAGWSLIAKMQRRAAANGGVDPELGRKRLIFVNSLSDFFDNHRSITWRAPAFEMFEASPDVILILVTKRPENVVKMVPPHWLEPGGWPAHVWLLVSVEDQERADHRIPILLSIPGITVRGISAEPLLGPVDLTLIPALGFSGAALPKVNLLELSIAEANAIIDGAGEAVPCLNSLRLYPELAPFGFGKSKLDWVIVGGESGGKARDNDFETNARSLLAQCTAAGVAFFGKQNVRKRPLPDDLLVREFPA